MWPESPGGGKHQSISIYIDHMAQGHHYTWGHLAMSVMMGGALWLEGHPIYPWLRLAWNCGTLEAVIQQCHHITCQPSFGCCNTHLHARCHQPQAGHLSLWEGGAMQWRVMHHGRWWLPQVCNVSAMLLAWNIPISSLAVARKFSCHVASVFNTLMQQIKPVT